MGLSSALNPSLNGLSISETTMEVLNIQIIGAAPDRSMSAHDYFTTELARVLKLGSAPRTYAHGGTNSAPLEPDASTANTDRSSSEDESVAAVHGPASHLS